MQKGYYTIENRAKRQFGITEIPEFAGYMLADGTMLNFSYEGRQRDIDHREINEFFRAGNNGWFSEPIYKFMNRGNIRCSCSSGYYGFEFIKVPTKEQYLALQRIHRTAEMLGHSFHIEKTSFNGKVKAFCDFYDFMEWLEHEADYYLI